MRLAESEFLLSHINVFVSIASLRYFIPLTPLIHSLAFTPILCLRIKRPSERQANSKSVPFKSFSAKYETSYPAPLAVISPGLSVEIPKPNSAALESAKSDINLAVTFARGSSSPRLIGQEGAVCSYPARDFVTWRPRSRPPRAHGSCRRRRRCRCAGAGPGGRWVEAAIGAGRRWGWGWRCVPAHTQRYLYILILVPCGISKMKRLRESTMRKNPEPEFQVS